MKAYRRRFVLFNMLLIGVVLTAMAAGIAVSMYHDYYDGLHDTMEQVVKPLSSLVSDTEDEAETAAADTADEASQSDEVSFAGDVSGENSDSGGTAATAAPSPGGESPAPSAGTPQPPDGGDAASRTVDVPQSPAADAAPMAGSTPQPGGEGSSPSPDTLPAPAQQPSEDMQPPADNAPQPSDGQAAPDDAPDAPADKPSQKPGSRKEITTVVYDAESGSAAVVSGASELDQDTLDAVLPIVSAQEEDFGTLSDYGLIYYRDDSSGTDSIVLTDTGYVGSSMADLLLALAAVWLCAMLCFFAVSLWLSKLAVRPMERAAEREKQFVADVSHDLKTPLAVIAANNSILLENPEAPMGSLSRWVDSTGQAARQMQGLVDEMLTLTVAQRGISTPLMPTDLSGAVTKAALRLESVAYDKQVALETDIAAHITVQGDPDALQRIVSSLIENAIKYEPIGGSVTVTPAAVRRQARLTVQNQGSVISPEALPHVFDRFYRGNKSRGSAQGHGLGLAIVRQLTENLGGSITVRSSEAEGTVFLVVLPGQETPQAQI